ncbi:hypothetical protein KAR10_01960 [bacterium]|nr:hypothetical protein [bacterium]
MRSKYQHLVVASMIFGLGLGISGLQAAAEEPGGENIPATTAAPTAEPTATSTISPVAAPVQTPPLPAKWLGKKHDEFGLMEKELELNWNVAIGTASYLENDETFSLSSKGVMLEINPGCNITTAPGLDIGMVVGFLLLNSEGSFNVTYEGPPMYTRNWEVSAMSIASYIMVKYSYDFDLGVIKLGLENGLGLGYLINSVSAEWVDASDSDISGDTSTDENGWGPVVKAGLKIALPVTKVSSLGLNLGANLIPLFAGDYSNFITISVGLNYQIKY